MSWEQRNHDFSAAQTNAQMAYIEAERENAKLRELVRRMFYAVHPHDRAQFLANVAELGVEVEE